MEVRCPKTKLLVICKVIKEKKPKQEHTQSYVAFNKSLLRARSWPLSTRSDMRPTNLRNDGVDEKVPCLPGSTYTKTGVRRAMTRNVINVNTAPNTISRALWDYHLFCPLLIPEKVKHGRSAHPVI